MADDDAKIAEAGRRLMAEAPDARVILFGSHARGSATARSDIDLLVIEPDVENTALEAVRLMRALRDLRLPLEVSSSASARPPSGRTCGEVSCTPRSPRAACSQLDA